MDATFFTLEGCFEGGAFRANWSSECSAELVSSKKTFLRLSVCAQRIEEGLFFRRGYVGEGGDRLSLVFAIVRIKSGKFSSMKVLACCCVVSVVTKNHFPLSAVCVVSSICRNRDDDLGSVGSACML